jgi:uncharacterized protein
MPSPIKAGLLLLLLLSLPASAMSLEDAMGALSAAKSSGLVGEQANGYLGVVQPNPRAAEIANQINQARRREYQKLAEQNSIKLQEVELLAGQKAMDKAGAGQYIQRNGAWLKK